MALVEYSDSESSSSDSHRPEQSHSESQKSQGIKRKHSSTSESTLPPLPDTFHDLYASTARVSNQDDPTLHGGRQRVTPHVEGNWPTHVYVEWFPSTEHSNRLSDLLTDFNNVQTLPEHQVHSLLRSDLGAELPLHISLSRPVVLLAHQRQPFIDAMTRAISKTTLSPFKAAARGLEWVVNYEKTRWFLVLKLERAPQDGLNKLLHLSNQTVMKFGQPPLYTDLRQYSAGGQNQKRQAGNQGRSKETSAAASSSVIPSESSNEFDLSSSFHVSIGWTLGAPTQPLREKLDATGVDFQSLRVDVTTVKVKIGNGITAISLATKIDPSNRIIEK
ncbi:poly(U)-specific 3'-to-5' RNA exonuclease [Imshaugia aleurites]|uniref:U6 snRNA phosphodiesterase n=1 Tax=Imshaugia aleurites TaxID=172621 RepID=A0A8H3EPG4_9LECA|nr:poly(U)-specific 3'-to-5' RNA exonuclease [Imshaugia aleurites]